MAGAKTVMGRDVMLDRVDRGTADAVGSEFVGVSDRGKVGVEESARIRASVVASVSDRGVSPGSWGTGGSGTLSSSRPSGWDSEGKD